MHYPLDVLEAVARASQSNCLILLSKEAREATDLRLTGLTAVTALS